MAHLVIAGHGWQKNKTFDPGATGYIKKGEHKYVVEDLFPAIKKQLPKGHNVIFYHEKKVSNYGNLVQLARQFKAKQVTEIHFDAHTLGSSARGGHVIIHKNFSPDKMDLALRDAIKNMVGVRYSHKGHEGISGRDNLYNVNQAAQNGITYRLIELGFGTNKLDADIMVNNVDDYARELVKAITGGNSTPTKKKNTPKSTPAKKQSTPKKYTSVVNYMKDNKMDASYGNRKKLAAKYGIKGYKGTAAQNIQLLNYLQGGPKPKPKNKTHDIKKLADKIYTDPKAPTGHEARRKWLGVDKVTYEKVRKELNSRF